MAFSLFKKRSQPTFKQRVVEFWDWWPTVAERFHKQISAGRCDAIGDEASETVARLFPSMAWCFGPGDDDGHSFTLSGEGSRARQFLTDYWKQQAPQVAGWTFHASRQAMSPEDLGSIQLGTRDEGEPIDAENFLLQVTLDEEDEVIDVVVWHPQFEDLPEEAHQQITFILLDEALGSAKALEPPRQAVWRLLPMSI